MSDMTLPDNLAVQLTEIARREQRSPEAVLETMFAQYQNVAASDDLEAEDQELEQLRGKFYTRARDYWRRVGDEERLALTDKQLAEQFWLFDQDDIPRLKSDAGSFELLPNPLAGLDGLLADATDATDLSTTIRETLKQSTHPQYGWTKRGRTD
ncbi:MAG: hypothetical protein H7175_09425 [Burkholderiales bacterium]|nr:hypothetical protein [Anaerolineae bacterium]